MADDLEMENLEEEDEEPLFADDIGDDDDLPPLPPPMPSLSSQLNSSRQHPTSTSADTSATGAGGGATADQTLPPAPQGNDLKKRKPVLTLKVDRIFSEKGLPYIESEFPKLKFRGKGHEVSDLQFLMKQYEHWGNRLYPKYTFKDVTQRIERLSTTKEFKNRLLTIRRRHARGGQATPPLLDSDDEELTASPPARIPQANGMATPPPSIDNPAPVGDGSRVSSSPERNGDGVLSSPEGNVGGVSSPHSGGSSLHGASPGENRVSSGEDSPNSGVWQQLGDDMDSDDLMACTEEREGPCGPFEEELEMGSSSVPTTDSEPSNTEFLMVQ